METFVGGRIRVIAQRRVDVTYRPSLCRDPATQDEKPMSESATDWIKPAIRAAIREPHRGHDVQVSVENVPYGMWVWDDAGLEHVHVTSRELKATLGPRGLTRFRRNLVRKSLTWNQLRETAGR
jgi:hypothetical protein